MNIPVKVYPEYPVLIYPRLPTLPSMAQKYCQVTACAIFKTGIQVTGYVRREMRTYSL